jgi:hypothetical protein
MRMIHENAPPSALRVLRIVVFGTWFARVAFKPLQDLAVVSPSLEERVSVMRLVPHAMIPLVHSTAFLYGLKAATLLCFALVIAGVALRPMMVLSCILMTVFAAHWRGFAGHIDHESILILLAGILMTCFTLADKRLESKGQTWPTGPGVPTQAGVQMTAVLALLALVYTMVGVYRVVHGSPEIWTTHSLTFWALRNAYETVEPMAGWGKFVITYPWLAKMLELGFPVVTFFELTSFAILFSRWYRYAFLLMMVPFHMLSLFVLDVFFWENMMLYVLMFTFWYRPVAGTDSP